MGSIVKLHLGPWLGTWVRVKLDSGELVDISVAMSSVRFYEAQKGFLGRGPGRVIYEAGMFETLTSVGAIGGDTKERRANLLERLAKLALASNDIPSLTASLPAAVGPDLRTKRA